MRALPCIVSLGLALLAWSAGPARGQPYDLLYEHPIGFDEDSGFATFLGRGVLMLAESGPGHPREARVFSAETGRPLRTLECPPIDYGQDDLSQPCPTAVAASGRFFVLKGSNVLRVFARNGALVRDILPPPGLPPDLFVFGRGFALRGRRIAVGGPAFDGGRRVPGIVVYVFDAVTGALLDQHRLDVPDGHSSASVAFAGRALVVRMPGDGPAPAPGLVAAVDARTGALLWSRDATGSAGETFATQLVGLGFDVMVGPHRLDARTGALKRTYALAGGPPYDQYVRVAAAGRRVVVASGPPSRVDVFSSDGALLETVVEPYELCDVFGKTVGAGPSRLLVTSGSYCGSGHAFVYRLG